MDNGKEFGQGTLSVLTNYIYWLALVNVYFVVCNLLFLFFFLTLIPSYSNIIVYCLTLIPTGPAIAALFYTLSKLIREKEISPTKDFFYGYKINFLDSLKVWVPMLVILSIIMMDIQYLSADPTTRNQVISGILIVLFVLLGTLSIYVFSISSNFSFRVRDIYRLSMYYSFTRMKHTVGNIGIVLITLFLMFIVSDFLLLFIAGLVAYALALNNHAIMDDIKEHFIKKEETTVENQDVN
ncbi:YesL family protein [Radiobacillus kanasensis]|uniref:YesL family protein n=1 Tax=Radiobacillus kanasensis TaxID=2844358 RepID=UPI001E39EE13|nr:YesL family protein [Radiobacillus kanasensis]UFT98767.1 YesL family protein [Radiobacillus kanasensis]